MFPVATTMDDVRRNIVRAAEAIGEPERGARLVEAFNKRLAALRPPPGAPRPVAAFYWARGYSSGDGTLAHAVVKAAGLDNLATRLGLRGSARLPLETFLTHPTDLIIMAGLAGQPTSLAASVLKHPGLARVLTTTPSVAVPGHLWICGTPAVAEAVARLVEARKRVAAPSGRTGRQNDR